MASPGSERLAPPKIIAITRPTQKDSGGRDEDGYIGKKEKDDSHDSPRAHRQRTKTSTSRKRYIAPVRVIVPLIIHDAHPSILCNLRQSHLDNIGRLQEPTATGKSTIEFTGSF
jgi:hypothetical protein